MHVTSLVLEDRSGARFSGVSLGLEVGSTVHHLTVRSSKDARDTHEAMLAS